MKCLWLLLLFFASPAIAQEVIEDKIVEALDSFSMNRPQEKAYLQTDKDTYVAGETIWMKAYISLMNKPTILSGIVYVTLSDEKGLVIEKRMLKLHNGSASGDIELKQTQLSGSYILHCYTLWMLNFPEFLYSRKINVYNANQTEVLKTKSTIVRPTMVFFPEGGNLVEGLTSIVAFKLKDNNLQGSPGKGVVVDGSNKVVANIATMHNDVGSFELTPLPGEKYYAIMHNNKEAKHPLPLVMDEGINLKTDNLNLTRTFVKVSRSEKNKNNYNDLILIAQQHNKIVYMAKLNMDEAKDAVAIKKTNLPPGIMQITILNAEGKPLVERLVFIHNQDTSAMQLNGSVTSRAKLSLTFDTSPFKDLDAAISIVNADLQGNNPGDNIFSGLLLVNDIKETVFNPGQYFKSKSVETIGNLDLIMLSHFWRRFKWDDILVNRYSALRFPFETGLSITGKVLHTNGKSTLPNAKINMIVQGEDSTKIISEASLTDRSDFVISDINFKKAATIYYQGTNEDKKNLNVSVTIHPAYIDTLTSYPRSPSKSFNHSEDPSAGLKTALELRNKSDIEKGKLLETVVLKSKKISKLDSLNRLYVSSMFEFSDQTFDMDGGHYFDIWQYLQRMVPGISIDKTNPAGVQINFSRFDGANMFSGDVAASSVQFFLNEVPVSENIIDVLNPDDVGLIKVYKGVTGIALGVDRGAIAIYTTKGKSTRDWRERGFDFFKKTGYSVNREFYETDYAKLNKNAVYTDHRSTIYWNPNIKIKDNKADIQFYNDDIARRLKIIIEGVDKNGKIFYHEKTVE